MSRYDVVRIQTLLGEHVNLKDFCFILKNALDNILYAYDALKGETPLEKSMSLVTLADQRDELGEIVLHLVDFWFDRAKGNKRLLLRYDIPQALYTYYEELLDFDEADRAADVRAAYLRIEPTFPAADPPPLPDTRGKARGTDDDTGRLGSPTAAQSHVFLSYSSQDADIMDRVHTELTAQGLNVWIDREGIEPGTPSWKIAIETAIDQAICLVVLLSPSAKGSKWVRAELDYAEAQNKPIFTILIEGDATSAAPFGFTTSQWIDLRNIEDYTILLEELAQSITNRLLDQ